eukprot:m.140314 g.140314  ORF g.140314 m.140314 type:complete len:428 (+) comp14946_c0_seq11:18-1301(+)
MRLLIFASLLFHPAFAGVSDSCLKKDHEQNSCKNENESPLTFGALAQALELDWDNNMTFEKALSYDRPILFRTSLLNPKEWSFTELAERLGEVLVRRKYEDGNFRYFNPHRLLSEQDVFPSLRATQDYAEGIVTGRRLVASLDSKKGFYYASQSARAMLPPSLAARVAVLPRRARAAGHIGDGVAETDEGSLRSIQESKERSAVTETAIGAKSEEESGVVAGRRGEGTQAWVSGAHVVAMTHYDTSDNLYVPLLGTKLFDLFPPEAHSVLRLYPSLHAHYRQAQVDPAAPSYSGPKAIHVAVHPGQMLFLPPYWFHRVTQAEGTFAANLWVQSARHAAMEQVYALAIPMEDTWTLARRVSACMGPPALLSCELSSSQTHMHATKLHPPSCSATATTVRTPPHPVDASITSFRGIAGRRNPHWSSRPV